MSDTLLNQTCSKCGASFTCDIQAGKQSCWCFDLPNIIPIDTISEEQGCLCRDCLQETIESSFNPK